ncbi:MAG: DNA N-6-adenine-methyltransferase [Bosea sp. (in: a-proteobacteria)]|nr:DNA N-6-adenine-methyltransferase [Bosea sp. (in: a-proteobacteria)]
MSDLDPQRSRIGSLIREQRKRQNITLAQLSELTGCAISTLHALEAKGRGTTDLIDKISPHLDLRFTGLSEPHQRLGLRILHRRRERGWTALEAALKADVSPAALRRLEAGQTARITTLDRLLAVFAPRLRLREPELSKFAGGRRDERLTTPEIWAKIEQALGGMVDVDPCAHPLSPVRAHQRYFPADDGLKQHWHGTAYINPPYTRTSAFCIKAVEEWRAGRLTAAIMLLQANMERHWFHDHLLGVADTLLFRATIRFLDENATKEVRVPGSHMICVLGGSEQLIAKLMAAFPSVLIPKDAVRSAA